MVAASFGGAVQGLFTKGYVPHPVEEASTWAPLVPMENAFIVRYDGETLIDDLAYIAAVPSAVFYDTNDDIVYGSPLLLWEPLRGLSGADLPQDSSMSIDYFMEDWMNYTDMQLDNIQYINMDPSDIDSVTSDWNVESVTEKRYNSNNPYIIAKKLALYNWRYSDEAVVAVIDNTFPEMDEVTEGDVQGVVPATDIQQVILYGEKEPSPVDPNMHNFNIGPDFKYVTSDMTWYGPSGLDTINSITQRGRDPDLQLYDMQLGQVAASEEWNVLSGVGEYIGSYVYHDGLWSSAVTYMPTESLALNEIEGKDPSKLPQPYEPKDDDNVMIGRPEAPTQQKPGSTVTYEITNTMFPGFDIELPDETPFMCRDGEFTLSWSGAANLGLLIRGPSNAVIAEDLGQTNPKTITIKDLGTGKYSVTAVRLTDSSETIAFNVSYKWHQYYPERYGDAMASASEGAVLASIKNAPLLYANKKGVPDATIKALNTLGVKKVSLVDLGGHSKGRVEKALQDARSWLQPQIKVEKFTRYENIYSEIKGLTDSNYIVFSTINPWTYWTVGEGPTGEELGGLYVGPGTYAAALHGTPLLITDVHNELSTSVAWNNAYWADAYLGRYPPSVGSMVLTGQDVYYFLELMDMDENGMEPMMTVAGQFDIGTSWDRTFVGAAVPGRIMGTPITTSQWIARSSLYTALIYSNPATDQGGIRMITGSESKFANGLVQTSPEHEINAQYPVVQSWVSYQHRFNERGSIYWGADYITADGITPYRSGSGMDIDVDNKWPDLTTSEVVPHYARKAGYKSVFSTNFDTTFENLNKGSIMWLEVMHGGNRGAGSVGFWNTQQKEPNPWRGYESGGSTFEPDTVIMGKNIGLDLLRNPTRSDRFHDGVIIAIVDQAAQTSGANGYDFDNAMGNMHSMGFNGGSCLIANTMMHLAMVRHGMAFQIIDPWLTSWYASFAMETWVRDMVLGYTVGEAYQHGIQHVGIQYLTEQWWWDIFENVVYYGDPNLILWMPSNMWDEPESMWLDNQVGGHTPHGADDHPHKVEPTFNMELVIMVGVAASVGVLSGITAIFIRKWRIKARKRAIRARLKAKARKKAKKVK